MNLSQSVRAEYLSLNAGLISTSSFESGTLDGGWNDIGTYSAVVGSNVHRSGAYLISSTKF
jgi:hypothetical protein